MRNRTVLVIDDQLAVPGSLHQKAFIRSLADPTTDLVFESCLRDGRYDVERALLSLQAIPNCDLVLLDIKFGPDDSPIGYAILQQLTSKFPHTPVLIMSSIDRDVSALGRCLEDGAVGFVRKSESPTGMKLVIEQAIAIAHSHALIGQSPPLRELRRQAARLSPYDQIPVLIVGPRGTGKERVARYIHHNGPRCSGPFVAVNCAGLSETLLESELFGAEVGAYTGADSLRLGYLERANGGVLFLDEIGNMPVSTQAKLLRALQDHTFRRVGVTPEEVTADFQLVCATNEEPETLIAEKRLREDLYDRIAAVTVRTPTLSNCRSDIPELARHFLRQLGLRESKEISLEALAALEEYDWPGNVRELRRVVQESVVASEGARVITKRHLPPFIFPAGQRRAPLSESARTPGSQESLPSDTSEWPIERLLSELRLAAAAKATIQQYKPKRWKAEFMRLMYPECKAQNAKGFDDLIRRLTKGPWGSTRLRSNSVARRLLQRLSGQ